MRPYRRKWILAVLVCLAPLAACDEFLDVTQTQEPATDAAFRSFDDFHATVGSIWRVWWGTAQSSRPTNGVQNWPALGLAVLAEELTTTSTAGHADVGREPREPYDNDQQGGNWFMRKPFYDLYHCNATATEALQYLAAGNRVINVDTGLDKTERAAYWTKMMQGLCHVYVGLLYDQGFTIDESAGDLTKVNYAASLKPYWEVTAFGIAKLEEALALAEAAPLDTIPGTENWLNGRLCPDAATKLCVINKPDVIGTGSAQCTNCQTLVEFMHSMIARAYAYNARRPGQRNTVGTGIGPDHTDWDQVLFHASRGVKADFWIQANRNNSGNDSRYKQYNFCRNGTTSTNCIFRTDNRIVGPADTSGAYQAWLAAPLSGKAEIVVKTPDRRINGPATATTFVPTNCKPVTATSPPCTDSTVNWSHTRSGTIFQITGSACSQSQATARGLALENCYNSNVSSFSTTLGTYPYSLYFNIRNGTNHYRDDRLTTTSAKEMAFLMAEAHIRLGDPAAAATLINAQGRTTGGTLPGVTATGVPPGPGCVPRKADGSCGDLFDALKYEKRIELAGLEAIVAFADARGWGLMVPGSICMLAIPHREMDAIGLAAQKYTFGGDTPGSVGFGPAASGATCTD